MEINKQIAKVQILNVSSLINSLEKAIFQKAIHKIVPCTFRILVFFDILMKEYHKKSQRDFSPSILIQNHSVVTACHS